MKFKRIAAILAAVIMSVVCIVPAFAANYTPVAGGTVTLIKQLYMEPDAEVPYIDFEFTLSSGTAVAGTANTLPVYPGPTPNLVDINGDYGFGYASFSRVSPATIVGNDKIATTNIVLDFSGVTFSEPGVYRYILTETANTEQYFGNDPVPTRTIDIYVNDNNGTLVVADYIVYSGIVTAGPSVDGTPLTTKDDSYENYYSTYNVGASKTVTGNQGSKDQYFCVLFEICNVPVGTVLTLDTSDMELAPLANAATPYTAAQMATANGRDDLPNVAGQQLVAEPVPGHDYTAVDIIFEVYLKHGQSVMVYGIPEGLWVNIEEQDADMYGYTTTNGSLEIDSLESEQVLHIVNDRSGYVPTGIIATIGVGATIVASAVAGYVVVNRKKSNED